MKSAVKPSSRQAAKSGPRNGVANAPRRAGKVRAARAAAPASVSAVASAGPGLPPDHLLSIIRPQAATRWMLPSLGAVTPQYIEMVLRGALAGNHEQQFALFDLMEDTWPHLGHCIQQIKRAVAGLDSDISAWAEQGEDPDERALLKMRVCSAAWRAMLPDPAADENDDNGTIFDLLDAWFKGYVVMEVDWMVSDSETDGPYVAPRATRWVHPVCYGWGADGRIGLKSGVLSGAPVNAINATIYQPPGGGIVPFPTDKFLIGVAKAKSGSPLGASLLRPLAWWWCAANFCSDWLLNLAQLFGIPFRWANYDPQASPDVEQRLCLMLQNMGSSGWGAFPTNTEIKFLESTRNAGTSPQADLLERADKAASLLILGQTLTGDTGGGGKGGGSLALGEVHETIKDQIVLAAGKYVAGVIGKQLFPSILRLNFGDTCELPKFQLISRTPENRLQKAQTVQSLVAAGAGKIIGVDWISQEFGIPKPAEGEETLATRRVAPDALDDANPNEEPHDDPADIPGDDAGDKNDDTPGDGDNRPASTSARLARILNLKDDKEFQAALRAYTPKK